MANNASTNNLLVVCGATGIQGGAVLRYFAQHPSHHGFRLRGLTRDPTSSKSQALAALGVEMVAAELDDLPSVQRAFADATHIFANTDSNALIYAAVHRPELLPSGHTATSWAAAAEARYGANIEAAAAAAATTASLRRLVWSSLPSPRKASAGALSAVTMFDVKDEIAARLRANPALRPALSVLMIGFYADNALNVPGLYAPKKADGTYELSFPMAGDAPVPIADVERDVGPWVHALFQAAPGLTLLGATETLSWGEWVRLWAEQNRVVARYRQAAPEEFALDMQPLRNALIEEFAFVQQYGFAGGDADAVYPDALPRVGISIDRSSIADHIRRSDWSSIL